MPNRRIVGDIIPNEFKKMGVHHYFRWALDDNNANTRYAGCVLFEKMKFCDDGFLLNDKNQVFFKELSTRMVTLLNGDSSSVVAKVALSFV